MGTIPTTEGQETPPRDYIGLLRRLLDVRYPESDDFDKVFQYAVVQVIQANRMHEPVNMPRDRTALIKRACSGPDIGDEATPAVSSQTPTREEVDGAIDRIADALRYYCLTAKDIQAHFTTLCRAARSSTRPIPTVGEIYQAIEDADKAFRCKTDPADSMSHAEADAIVDLLERIAKQ